MTHEDIQARAQRVTNVLLECFPNPKDVTGYLIAALVRNFEVLHYTEAQMAKAVVEGARALRVAVKRSRPILTVVSPETFRKTW